MNTLALKTPKATDATTPDEESPRFDAFREELLLKARAVARQIEGRVRSVAGNEPPAAPEPSPAAPGS